MRLCHCGWCKLRDVFSVDVSLCKCGATPWLVSGLDCIIWPAADRVFGLRLLLSLRHSVYDDVGAVEMVACCVVRPETNSMYFNRRQLQIGKVLLSNGEVTIQVLLTWNKDQGGGVNEMHHGQKGSKPE